MPDLKVVNGAAAEKKVFGGQLNDPFTHPSGLVFKNRIFLAPLTRGRSGLDRVPKPWNVDYYTQRASAGLVITEGTTFGGSSEGWKDNAAINTPEQVEGWKKVTDSVHAAGGLICCQLWHLGRASHSSFQPNNGQIVAPSAIAIVFDGLRDANDAKVPYEVPHALTIPEIKELQAMYKHAAENCLKAGFDMIEVHSANGYLLDSFLQTCSNKRDDAYGGSLENRFRFLKEVIEAVCTVYPSNKVGVRFSPNGMYNGQGSPDNIEAFTYFASQLNNMDLGYLHVMDGLGFGFHKLTRPMTLSDFRKVYDGMIISNCGLTRDTADGVIRTGAADACAFGRPYIGNPDLVERFQNDWPLVEASPALWFTHDKEGYSDWPAYKE